MARSSIRICTCICSIPFCFSGPCVFAWAVVELSNNNDAVLLYC